MEATTAPDDVPTGDAPAPARTVAYGPDDAQVYDVRLPAQDGARDATVVVIHGGFWRAQWSRAHAAGQAQAFADDGFHAAVVEYRRVGMPGGGWPGTAEDVAAAIAAVRADAMLPSRAILVGHSAGGHLAAWAASRPWAHGLRGAISLAGCVDLALTARTTLGDGAALALMGSAPDAGSKEAQDSWAEADPARHPPVVPVVLLHGADDDTVPPQVSRSYQRAVAQSCQPHAQVRLTVIPDCGHFGLIDPGHPAFGQVLRAARWMT